MKRIGILQIVQESNTFNPVLTTRSEFERFGTDVGGDVLANFARVDEIGDFLNGLREWDVEVDPVGVLSRSGVAWRSAVRKDEALVDHDYELNSLRWQAVGWATVRSAWSTGRGG